MTAAATELDGRRLRREHNRDAVLDALVELFREGVYQPSAQQIAERAGLSPRSLFRYFDDVDDLTRTAIDRQLEGARPLLDPGVTPSDPTATKVERLVHARAELFEATAPAARAARVCAPRNHLVAAQVVAARSFLRHQLGRLFAPELTGARAGFLPALDALCSFETYELLRGDQGLSRPRTVAALALAVGALLGTTETPT